MSDQAPGAFPGDVPRQIRARRGFSVSYKGKTLLSCLDPISQAERIAEGIAPADRTLYFCPSPLYGYGLKALLEKIEKTSPHSAVLCLEADEQLLAFSENNMDPRLRDHPRLRLTGVRDSPGLCRLVRKTWGSRSFRRLETLRLSAGWRLDPELYDSLADALRRDIALDWGNAMTLVKLGRLYIRNAVKNLALISRAPSLSALSFGGDPVLVLGAGPSLDPILEGLIRHFGNGLSAPDLIPRGEAPRPFRIIAVDTALPCLLARNIKPDLVAALESQHWNLRDFIGAGNREIPAAMDLSALPATRDLLGGKLFLFFTPWAEIRLFKRLEALGLLPEIFPPLGSVGLSAAAIALSLGTGPVITGGIDFSFTLDTYHARSTPGHQEKLRRQNRFRGILNAEAAFRPAAFRAAAKSGVFIFSDPALRGYRDLFEREFAGEKRLRDINGAGLPLGIPAVDIKAACQILESRSPPSTLHPPPSTLHPPPSTLHPPSSTPFTPDTGTASPNTEAALRGFVNQERESLVILRKILTGETRPPPEELEGLLDKLDYLWAHFPDCAGAGGRRPPGTDISFLKRVRAEIDPFIRLWEFVSREIDPAK